MGLSPWEKKWPKYKNQIAFLLLILIVQRVAEHDNCIKEVRWKSLSCVQLFVTPCNIVHGILQARILEWVVFSFSRGSSKPRDWTQVSGIAGRFFISWATREAPIKETQEQSICYVSEKQSRNKEEK